MGEYLTIEEMAEVFKVQVTTVRRWRRWGLPFYRVGKRLYFKREEALRWIRAHNHEGQYNPEDVGEIPPGGGELLTLKEVAKELHLTPRTLKRWAEVKGFPYHRVGKTMYVFRDELDAWVKEQQQDKK